VDLGVHEAVCAISMKPELPMEDYVIPNLEKLGNHFSYSFDGLEELKP